MFFALKMSIDGVHGAAPLRRFAFRCIPLRPVLLCACWTGRKIIISIGGARLLIDTIRDNHAAPRASSDGRRTTCFRVLESTSIARARACPGEASKGGKAEGRVWKCGRHGSSEPQIGL